MALYWDNAMCKEYENRRIADWVDDGLAVRVSDACGRRLDQHYQEALTDTHRQRVDGCTRRLWRARMGNTTISTEGPMWRQLRREVMAMRVCLEDAAAFDSVIEATEAKMGAVQGVDRPAAQEMPF